MWGYVIKLLCYLQLKQRTLVIKMNGKLRVHEDGLGILA